MSTDTACSSSLVAAHLGHAGVLGRECGTALAAGVNAMLSPDTSVKISQLQVRPVLRWLTARFLLIEGRDLDASAFPCCSFKKLYYSTQVAISGCA